MAHSSSWTWVSNNRREFSEHQVRTRRWRKMYGSQAPLPWTLSQWFGYCADCGTHGADWYRAKTQQLERQQKAPPIMPAFGGNMFTQGPGRSAVLAQSSMWVRNPKQHYHNAVKNGEAIWSPNYNSYLDREGGNRWPLDVELNFEGDQRIRTEGGRFGRQLPLVRISLRTAKNKNPDYSKFNEIDTLLFFDFDDPWPVPTAESIWMGPVQPGQMVVSPEYGSFNFDEEYEIHDMQVAEQDPWDDVPVALLGHDLLGALDA